MRASTRKKMRWCFGGSRVRRIGLLSSKPARSARTIYRDAGACRPYAGSYELAARHGRHLPASQAPRRCGGHRLARGGTRPLLHKRGRHRATGLLGTHEGWTAASGLTGLATRLVEALGGRIHGFNVSVAHVWAEQERLLEKAGRRMPVEDSYIAATARRHGLTIATDNDRDFRRPGLKVFNPFKELTESGD